MSLKPVNFCGNSLERLRDLHGATLDVSFTGCSGGRDPSDWKPMPDVGKGVREIRIRDENGIYRMIYVAIFWNWRKPDIESCENDESPNLLQCVGRHRGHP